MSAGLFVACEVCGKLVSKAWFGIVGDRRLKCGACCNPPRAEDGPYIIVNVNHDPGDEHRERVSPSV